jgi:hypothetical protein
VGYCAQNHTRRGWYHHCAAARFQVISAQCILCEVTGLEVYVAHDEFNLPCDLPTCAQVNLMANLVSAESAVISHLRTLKTIISAGEGIPAVTQVHTQLPARRQLHSEIGYLLQGSDS